VARRKKPEEHSHSESWLVSYCDMISLLVTFFLMMMTFSTNSENDVREAGIGLLRGRGGIWENSISMPEEVSADPDVREALAQDLAKLCMADENGKQPVSMQSELDGLSLSFDLDASFAPGSAELTAGLREKLTVLGRILQRSKQLVVVEGFTDSQFLSSPDHPDPETLGIARAEAAARFLLANSALTPDQIQIASPGMLNPRAPNDTVMGRKSNRRVEIHILARALPDSSARSSSSEQEQ